MKIIAFCILALFLSINTQDTLNKEVEADVEQQNKESASSETIDPTKMTEEQQLESTKNIFYSCIVVARNYLSFGEGVIDTLKNIADTFESQPEKQIQAWKRIYLDRVKQCANDQTHEGALAVYKQLYQSKFDPKSHFYLVENVNLSEYNNKDLEFSFNEEDNIVWQMMEEFEKKIKQQNDKDDEKSNTVPKSGRERREEREEKERQDKSEGRSDASDYEPKIFGVSTKAGSKFMQVTFLLGFFGIFFLVLFSAFKILTKEDKPKDKKKSKKDKKTE